LVVRYATEKLQNTLGIKIRPKGVMFSLRGSDFYDLRKSASVLACNCPV
jgi:hypothetical protein